MINHHRGEVALKLEGQDYRLRPSFTALVRVEAQCGSLLGLAERAGNGQLRLEDIVTLIWACLDAGGTEMDKAELGDKIIAAGLAQITPVIRDLLTIALKGVRADDERAAAH